MFFTRMFLKFFSHQLALNKAGVIRGYDIQLKMDPETGERCPYAGPTQICCKPILNVETGEYEDVIYFSMGKFRIPSCLYTTEETECTKNTYKPLRVDKQELQLITAIIFLLPTMICFSKIMWTFVLLLEILLHHWAHRKNRTIKNGASHYRSPLHIMVKEFCGKCKDEAARDKITKIQDIRNDKLKKYGLESLRRVVT